MMSLNKITFTLILLILASSSCAEVENKNDIVYFNIFGKVIGLENIYYFSFDNDGVMQAQIRPEFELQNEYHSFLMGKFREGELNSWNKLLKEYNGTKITKCGVNSLNIKIKEDFSYNVIHDENEYIVIGSNSKNKVNSLLKFICNFNGEVLKEKNQ